ncbi:MAG: hypothetical protein AB7G75_12200 [Candidatus Binatia bacterium]
MIVLDEELQGLGLEEEISHWYRGSVVLIKTLRPGTVIKDEAVPKLLRQVRQPTFVTINHNDFWRRVAAEKSFCLLCFRLTADQVDALPHLLRRIFKIPQFQTKSLRMGKIALVSQRNLQYYDVNDSLTHVLGWLAIK